MQPLVVSTTLTSTFCFMTRYSGWWINGSVCGIQVAVCNRAPVTCFAFVVNFCWAACWIYIVVNIGIRKSTIRGFIHGIQPVQVKKRRHLCWWCLTASCGVCEQKSATRGCDSSSMALLCMASCGGVSRRSWDSSTRHRGGKTAARTSRDRYGSHRQSGRIMCKTMHDICFEHVFSRDKTLCFGLRRVSLV